MEDYPRTQSEFEDRFSSEEACREYLVKLRLPEGFRCPRCLCEESWSLGNGLFKCARCKYKISVTAGTVL